MQREYLTTVDAEAIAEETGPYRGVMLDPYTLEVTLAVGEKAWIGSYREALESDTIAAYIRPDTKMLMRMNVAGTEQGWGGKHQ